MLSDNVQPHLPQIWGFCDSAEILKRKIGGFTESPVSQTAKYRYSRTQFVYHHCLSSKGKEYFHTQKGKKLQPQGGGKKDNRIENE